MSEIAIVMNVELSDAQALALAQFLKRLGWTDVRENAASTDETNVIQDALRVVQRELSAHGYSPR